MKVAFMKSKILLVFCCFAILADSAIADSAKSIKDDYDLMAHQAWTLVWCDEFNYEGHPDPAKWDYEEGLVRNNEKQYYTRGRLENARVENGCLVIEARKEKWIPKNQNMNSKHAEYTSASIITKEKASWLYGRIEVRAKLPRGKGVWPAIWMLGDKKDWPDCGEIDIMEFVGHTPDKIYGTVHYSHDDKHLSKGENLTVAKPWEDFHIYAVEWNSERIDFYYDSKCYYSFTTQQALEQAYNPFQNKQYLLLNLALGGEWGGDIDDSILPQKYYIDYVRVYQRTKNSVPKD